MRYTDEILTSLNNNREKMVKLSEQLASIQYELFQARSELARIRHAYLTIEEEENK